jgi:ketosteroid isomerase-like protein
MKNRYNAGMMILCSISMFIACNPPDAAPAEAAVDIEQIKNEIQAKENEFAEIYNTGELKQIGYYAEDATTFAQNRAPIVGREAIIEYLTVDIESNTDKISFTTKEVFVSNNANLVVEIGYYQVVDSANTTINSGNYMCLFEKRDGRYYCVREMSVSDMPVQETE